MQFSAPLTVFASFVAAVSAVNYASICTDTNLGGDCATLSGGNNVCINLVDFGFNDSIGSIQQFPGVSCSFWTDDNCSGNMPIKGAKGTGVINVQGSDSQSFSSARCTS
ncbi:hypothetical protein B7463_g4957, partial [Scytalidium lignicola]